MDVRYTIIYDIKPKQLIWYGHVQRMSEDKLLKQIINWLLIERKNRGRSRRCQLDRINTDLKERDLIEDLQTDREKWRFGV